MRALVLVLPAFLLLAACCRCPPPQNAAAAATGADGSGSPPGGATSSKTNGDPAAASAAAEPLPPGVGVQGAPCAERDRCATGLECVVYYGVAGASGPRFATCEIRCDSRSAKCPPGQACVTVSDGPGRVCQQMSKSE